jgi:glycosyltransferase involved in cell wall biosynthesis
MKLLFVQKEGGIFGAENYHLAIIPILLKHGYNIEFLRLYTRYQGGKGGPFIEKLKSLGIKTYELNIGYFINPLNLWRIFRLVKKKEYDIVHTHLIHAELHLALVKMLFYRKLLLVSTKHGYDNSFTAKHGFDATKQGLNLYFIVSKFVDKWLNESFAISHSLLKLYVDSGISNPNKISLIHYGFNFDEPDQHWRRAEYRYFKHQLLIAGRLVRFKGHRYVIESMPHLIKKFPGIGLVIVGSGQLEDELKELVSSLHLKNHVIFAGYKRDVPVWMYNSDIVLVPSISEGFGVVLLEAFNCSKPVIAFDVPACNEIIENNLTGFLVKPYSIDNMVAVISNLLETPALAHYAGANANTRLKTYFNLDRMADQTVQFYEKLFI